MALTGKQDPELRRKNNLITTIICEIIGGPILGLLLGLMMKSGGDLDVGSIMTYLKSPDFNISDLSGYFVIGIIVGVALCYWSYMNYERLKNTMIGKEHGTSAFLTAAEMPKFNQSFFFDPKIVGKVEGWDGNKRLEKKNTFYNQEELKKVCKNMTHNKHVWNECFKNCQIMGQDVYLSMNCKFINRNLNTLTIGGSGQGKSYSELFPNALLANSNYIFTDPSGEILQKVGKFLKKKGYKLKVFNVDEFNKSMKYNPLKYVETEKDYNILVDALNKNIKGGAKKSGGSNEFFDDAKDSLMTALFAYLKERFPTDEESVIYQLAYEKDKSISMLGRKEAIDKAKKSGITKKQIKERIRENELKQTLKNVMRLLLMAEQEVRQEEAGEVITSTLDECFKDLVERDPRSYAAAQWKSFKVGGPKVCNEVIISASAVFGRFFNTDDLEWLTSYDELDLYELASEKKCALFLVTPQDTTTYNFMAAMIYSQLFGIVMKAGKNYRDQRGTDNPALPRHLSFWLDEFANIGKIPNFLELLSVVRKYNISINIIIQGMAQLKGLYKESEWEVVLANLDTMIYLGGMEPSTVKWLAEKLGKRTIKQISSNRNAKSAGESYQNMSRNLLDPNEIEQMARAHELIFISGCKPIQTKKYNLANHPYFKYCGEADPKNNYNILDLVKPEDAEIDYDLLDKATLTVQMLQDDDPNSIPGKKGHRVNWVEPRAYKSKSIEELYRACEYLHIDCEPDVEDRLYYSKLLYEYEHSSQDNPEKQRVLDAQKEVEEGKVNQFHPVAPSDAVKDNCVSKEEQAENKIQKKKAEEGLNKTIVEGFANFRKANEVDYETILATEDDDIFGNANSEDTIFEENFYGSSNIPDDIPPDELSSDEPDFLKNGDYDLEYTPDNLPEGAEDLI